jgi:hypothetical protein
MDYFYDGQIRRYLTQFIRALSGFQYSDGQGNLKTVPVRFGTANKQAAAVLKQNSENFLNQAPFISVYVNNLELSRGRMQDPNFVSKVHVTERDWDGTDYTATKGADVTVERLMPNPYQLSLMADIWTTNIDQKLQILEQIVVLFNPAIEFQTSSSYLDWTSLSTLELMDIQYTNQVVPTGDQDLEIASLTFSAPIWLSAPAKVKRMGVITSIIARVFDEEGNISSDILAGSLISQQVITFDGYGILITDNPDAGTGQYIAKLLAHVESVSGSFTAQSAKLGKDINWREILERYPGKFTAGLSKVQIMKPDGRWASAAMSLNSNDETMMNLDFKAVDESWPTNTLIASGVNGIAARGTIDAIIDPTKPVTMNKVPDLRFLILESISTSNRTYDTNQDNTVIVYQGTNSSAPNYNVDLAGQPIPGQVLPGVQQWGGFTANANDIIMWDGTQWSVIFNSQAQTGPTFITNKYTGIQYKWEGESWTKSMEGVYLAGKWQVIL